MALANQNSMFIKLQPVIQQLKPVLLPLSSIVSLSTKSWKSQNTVVIVLSLPLSLRSVSPRSMATLCILNRALLEGNECDLSGLEGCLRQVNEDHPLNVNKPPSLAAVFHILNNVGNPGEIDGKDVILCFQSNGSKTQNVSDICDLFEDMNV